jgi:hypothetical protein
MSAQYYKITRRLGTPHRNSVTVTIPLVGPQGPAGPAGPKGDPGEVSGSIAYENITNLPETFPPEAHTHTADQIVDFTAAVEAVSPPADWDTLANKPSTFPPSAHGHVASDISDFSTAAAAAAPVQSVAGRTGTVTLAKADVGLSNVDNTADLSKPISTATQSALDGKAATSHTHTASQVTDFNTAAAAAAPVQSVNGNTGTVTVAVPSASTATPQPLGTAAAGTSDDYSRGDHIHAAPALNDLSNVSAAAPSDNDVLVFDTATGNWVAEAAAGGGATTQTDIFTANDTWTKPAGAKKVHVFVVGGGGGGGAGRRAPAAAVGAGGGGGGGGAGMFVGWVDAAQLSSTESVTIGAGGDGAPNQSTNTTSGVAGTAGGNTSFGAIVAKGGGGGGGGTTGTGGAGGSLADTDGVVSYRSAGLAASGSIGSRSANAPAAPLSIFSPAGGGGGGGRSSDGTTIFLGGDGGSVGTSAWSTAGPTAASQTAGANAFPSLQIVGVGASGGSTGASGEGNVGGNGIIGSGGGGGSFGVNDEGGSTGGGNGGDGIVIITTYF